MNDPIDDETTRPPGWWTVETLAAYTDALRKADERFQAERDRRYAEVNVEREKALKIKETADLAALRLAREIQTYKDEKANELRAQIETERGDYMSRREYNDAHVALIEKVEAGLKPLEEYVTAARSSQGAVERQADASAVTFGQVVAVVGVGVTSLGVIGAILIGAFT